jgi:hypothetical protein
MTFSIFVLHLYYAMRKVTSVRENVAQFFRRVIQKYTKLRKAIIFPTSQYFATNLCNNFTFPDFKVFQILAVWLTVNVCTCRYTFHFRYCYR